MAGTVLGGKFAADTNRKRYGADFYARIGSIGGRAKGIKGFAVDDRNFLQKLFRQPTRAQRAGKVGRAKSRRGKKEN